MRKRTLLPAAGLLTATALMAAFATPAAADHAFYVNTTADTQDANVGDGWCADADGNCSLRAAVQESNAKSGDNAIILQHGATYWLTIGGAGEDRGYRGDLDVWSGIEVQGNQSTIDANHLDRAFDVMSGAWLSVEDLTIVHGAPSAGESGGAIQSAGHLDVMGSTLHWNAVEGMGASGGAIFNSGGMLNVSHSRIENNSAARAGGGIEANAGKTVLNGVWLSYNNTGAMPGNGGGLHLTGAGSVDVLRSYVTNNTATAEGGGLWNSAVGTMNVTGSFINNNVAQGADADQGGGGLFNDGGSLTVTDSQLNYNVASGRSGSGGGILNNQGSLAVYGTTIWHNTSNRAGGGVEANVGKTYLRDVSLRNNVTGATPGNGGGLHLTGAGRVDIEKSNVFTNTALAEGGGLWNSSTGTMIVTGTTISSNFAPIGPDVFNDGGTFTIDGAALGS